ncbi:MAG: ribonuclease H family protein [Bacteroides sp.]|nr:ribonuclease H family protein [Bacteroides sp.]MCM1413977.1 ribonuclease H family protein [Bacteroides sp.]MCM1471806.1 ribonuclease H family protein [Bacteroides sp.]
MAPSKKYYVVWAGHDTGVFDSWEECKLQTENFPGARFKSFTNREAAIEAYRGDPNEHLGLFRGLAARKTKIVNYDAIPEIVPGSIAVDAACSRNPGPVEYRGVDISTGAQLFHVGPLADGTNNIGEFLAIVHALAWFDKIHRPDITIYSDSRTAMAWVRNRHAKTSITPTESNLKIRQLIARAENWLQTHTPANRVLKWDTENWGEIPADFGRK